MPDPTTSSAPVGSSSSPSLESTLQLLLGRLSSLESQFYPFMASVRSASLASLASSALTKPDPKPADPAAPSTVPSDQEPIHVHASQAGIDLIITEEDSGKVYYTKHYTHFEWPEGASGPTAGIGYDCGYQTAEQIRKDWTGIVDAETVEWLVKAAGLKGQAAAAFVRENYSKVTITWDQAMAEFDNRELPREEAECRAALPNYDALPGDCAGSIDSLGYNRGVAGFHAAGDRYREMRAIHDHMAARRFGAIPAEILSMRRLWPEGGDLWRRRGHEAALFEQGLKAAASA